MNLKHIAILNTKGVDYGCILWGISKNDAISRLNNSVLKDKGVLKIDFGVNKTPVEVIKEGALGGTYCREIFSGVNEKWYRQSWKELDQLRNIDQKYYYSSYDVSVNKYGFKCGTLLRFWKSNRWINEIDPYGWFQCYFRYCLGRRSKDDERQINRWKGIVSSFKGKLVKMVKDAGRKFDDYSISPKIRQILLHWGYELTEKDFFINSTN